MLEIRIEFFLTSNRNEIEAHIFILHATFCPSITSVYRPRDSNAERKIFACCHSHFINSYFLHVLFLCFFLFFIGLPLSCRSLSIPFLSFLYSDYGWITKSCTQYGYFLDLMNFLFLWSLTQLLHDSHIRDFCHLSLRLPVLLARLCEHATMRDCSWTYIQYSLYLCTNICACIFVYCPELIRCYLH